MRIAVLVSGRGSNLQALLDDVESPARVVLVGCNRADAPAIARARAAGVPVCLVDRAAMPRRAQRQTVLREALEAAGVELVVLVGFDEILGDGFVQAFAGRMINTHPALLPAFGGTMHAVADALAAGVKVSGCTVHLVTEDVDAGPILAQRCVEVRDDDDVETLHARIREQEHRLLREVVRAFADGRVRIEGTRARVVGSEVN
jgi:phosphoribosylglycinamide formyltransferase-1